MMVGSGTADFGILGLWYRALTPRERVHLEDVGAAATRAHRAGYSNVFGNTAREQQRRERMQALESLAQASIGDDGQPHEERFRLVAQQQDDGVGNLNKGWCRVLALRLSPKQPAW